MATWFTMTAMEATTMLGTPTLMSMHTSGFTQMVTWWCTMWEGAESKPRMPSLPANCTPNSSLNLSNICLLGISYISFLAVFLVVLFDEGH